MTDITLIETIEWLFFKMLIQIFLQIIKYKQNVQSIIVQQESMLTL